MHFITRFMKLFFFFFFFFFFFSFMIQSSQAHNTLNQSQQLFVNQTLTSPNHIFELGFFPPNNSDRFYLGLWYKNIPDRRILWVANRDHPLSAKHAVSGSLRIGPDGNLRIEDGKTRVVWSTSVSSQSNDAVVVLTDRGDLILHDAASGSVLWESFNYPTDTLIPGMTTISTRSGEKRRLVSWKSRDDPAPGKFSMGPTVGETTEGIIWNGTEVYFRTGPWNGMNYIGVAFDSKGFSHGIYVVQDKVQGITTIVYNTYDYSKSTLMTMLPSGVVSLMTWSEQSGQWIVNFNSGDGLCDPYGLCGAYAVCDHNGSPLCSCLKGFRPRSEVEWGKGIWRGGCVRKTGLFCPKNSSGVLADMSKADGFHRLGVMKLPDVYELVRGVVDVKGCEKHCFGNCSCVAFSYPQEIGCLVWTGDLVDIARLPFSGEDLYVRLSYLDLESSSGEVGTRIKIIVSLMTVPSVFVLAVLIYFFRKPKSLIRGRMRKRGKVSPLADEAAFWRTASLASEDQSFTSTELPIIDYEELVASTDNFSDTNKLGEGGFGHVFKGTMESGQDIAVKRLLSVSDQGIEEFKNEILLISKLQHRNLVKLVGCCVHGEEKLLVYEYMKNKSLDAFLFDSTKKQQLGWSKRFHIIQGIARGLLYLHRDSCLRVIHRDLKASNVLLDDDMNPKIADFGLARAFRVTQELANTHRVVGTFGYMSPEYAIWGLFSEKSDVYSFGVLMLEIISGKRNSGFFVDEDYLGLISHTWKLWNEKKGLSLMDDMLVDSNGAVEVLRCIHIGLLCVQDQPSDRPTMFDVIFMLSSDVDIPQPKQPTFTLRSWLESTSGSPSTVCSVSTEDTSLFEGR